jgi:hypothetical protein
MAEFFVIGMILTFIISILLCRYEEKRHNGEIQYGMSAILAIMSWLGLVILAIGYRNEIMTILRLQK